MYHTSTPELTTAKAPKREDRSKYTAITDVEEIKNLLLGLTVDCYNNILSNPHLNDDRKLQELVRLSTGRQVCGYIVGIEDLAQLEELIHSAERVARACVLSDPSGNPDNYAYHLFELYLPKGVQATTEWTCIRTLIELDRKQPKVDGQKGIPIMVDTPMERDAKTDPFFFRKSDMAPVATDIFHFVVKTRYGKWFLDGWSPGKYYRHRQDKAGIGSTDIAAVRLGDKRHHAKPTNTALINAMVDLAKVPVVV